MINCGVFVQCRPCLRMKTSCLASPSLTAEHLRQQLDSLHKEANITRDKASNARLRLMRLSEAVEKLRRQAAVSVQTGKENDARELLFQKRNVMQAMDKLKRRIELFDELSSKLNEAISTKESLLVGNMALDVDMDDAEAPSHIRIVSPVQENSDSVDDNKQLDPSDLEFEDDQNLHIHAGSSQVDTQDENESDNPADTHAGKNEQMLTYEDYIKHIDLQLSKIEQELETFLKFSTLLLDSKEKPEYFKVLHASEILEDVHRARERIATLKRTELNSNETPS